MANGQPLTDADRWDWLILLREQALLTLSKPFSTATSTASTPSGVIVTCSALKRKYRDVLRIASYHRSDVDVHFVFLQATEALLMDRVRARQNHYMKDYMVHSQFQSLEAPQEDELKLDVLGVDASGTSAEVQELALEAVSEVTKASR
jgi:gluconokinase